MRNLSQARSRLASASVDQSEGSKYNHQPGGRKSKQLHVQGHHVQQLHQDWEGFFQCHQDPEVSQVHLDLDEGDLQANQDQGGVSTSSAQLLASSQMLDLSLFLTMSSMGTSMNPAKVGSYNIIIYFLAISFTKI